MAGIATCLWFTADVAAAARFYASLFPDAAVEDVHYYGEGAPVPAGTPLMASLRLGTQRFQLLNGGPVYRLSPAASISVSCETQDEIDRLWTALTSNGGMESRCGWLIDRFGLSWQIVPARLHEWMREPAAALRVIAAFTPMAKLDIATLARAAAGG